MVSWGVDRGALELVVLVPGVFGRRCCSRGQIGSFDILREGDYIVSVDVVVEAGG